MPGNDKIKLGRDDYKLLSRPVTIQDDLNNELWQHKELQRKFWARESIMDKEIRLSIERREAEAPAASRPAAGEKN